MPRPCNASPSACTSARRSQRSSRTWTRSSTAWLSGYARAKHSVSCSELSSLPLRQRARPQARRSRSRSAAASGPKVSRSLASRRMARARWGTRRVLLTRASLFAGDAVLLYHAVEVVAIDAREARGFGHVVLCALELSTQPRARYHALAKERTLLFSELRMSLEGQQRTSWLVKGMSALPPKA